MQLFYKSVAVAVTETVQQVSMITCASIPYFLFIQLVLTILKGEIEAIIVFLCLTNTLGLNSLRLTFICVIFYSV